MLWFILISEIGAHLREWHLRILCPGWEAHLPHPSSPILFGKIPLLKSSPKLWILKGLDPLCWCDNTSLPPFVGFAAKVLCLRPSAKGLPWIAGARSAWRFMSLRWPFTNVWQRPRYKGPAHWLPDLPNFEAQFLSQSFLEYQLSEMLSWVPLPPSARRKQYLFFLSNLKQHTVVVIFVTVFTYYHMHYFQLQQLIGCS